MFVQANVITHKIYRNGQYQEITQKECVSLMPSKGQKWPTSQPFTEVIGYRKKADSNTKDADEGIKVIVWGYSQRELFKGKGLYAFDSDQSNRKGIESYIKNGAAVAYEVWQTRDMRFVRYNKEKSETPSVIEVNSQELFTEDPTGFSAEH